MLKVEACPVTTLGGKTFTQKLEECKPPPLPPIGHSCLSFWSEAREVGLRLVRSQGGGHGGERASSQGEGCQ